MRDVVKRILKRVNKEVKEFLKQCAASNAIHR